MPPPTKSASTASAAKDRRKSSTVTAAATTSSGTGHSVTSSSSTADSSSNGPRQLVTLIVAPRKLRAIVDPKSRDAAFPNRGAQAKESTSTPTVVPAVHSNGDNGSDSNSNTPFTGTPAPHSIPMGPPTEGLKKRGTKRGVAVMNGEPKVRGKPGPKKKMRLEDGTMECGRAGGPGAHKLGPKANMGAINAGLRALDRSGKPCRKWTKAGFTLKSFTGVVWEINRWSAPPKARPDEPVAAESATASAADSGKENNKESPDQLKSDHSNNGVDVEMQSVPSIGPTMSPAPPAIAAA